MFMDRRNVLGHAKERERDDSALSFSGSLMEVIRIGVTDKLKIVRQDSKRLLMAEEKSICGAGHVQLRRIVGNRCI